MTGLKSNIILEIVIMFNTYEGAGKWLRNIKY